MSDVAITGISSMATRQVLADITDAYALRTGRRVMIESVGGVAALRRVEEGEAFDFVVLASGAIDKLAVGGRIDVTSRVGLARSGIAMAVAAGAVRPSIGNAADVREAVLAARSIGYSTGPSGVHLMQLLERWGIKERVVARIVQAPPGVAVGTLIARGEVALGFQQMSELVGVGGIEILGSLPDEVQAITVFQAAICTRACSPWAARELFGFMTSGEMDAVKIGRGMEAV